VRLRNVVGFFQSSRCAGSPRRPVVARHLDLECELSSARRARLFFDAACTDWQLEVIRDDAMVVVSELVANAVVHAGTGCRVVLRYGARGLTIAVYDHAPDLALPLRPVTESQRGHGLFMVAALSLHWGLSRSRGEKCVWAFLPATAAAAYSHTVRAAAHDAVRTVLAHGPKSPDAANAVGHLVARLKEHHGPQFVQEVADELGGRANRGNRRDRDRARARVAPPTRPDALTPCTRHRNPGSARSPSTRNPPTCSGHRTG
jgi:anti-sigma regulatory factor (Ser/Thr protein kinase)